MIDIQFEVDGRPIRPDQIADALESTVCRAIEDDIRDKLGGVRDPETGEFPVIVLRGHSLDSLSIEVSGSPKVVSMVEDRLREDYDMTSEESVNSDTGEAEMVSVSPRVFLCHGSEDKPLVRKLARKLQANGIETFFDEWEIRSGDSIRQKIDGGLSTCTHFIALITETSIRRPWVNAEMDAAFVRKVNGKCRFIPLRVNLQADCLPPLLAALHAPGIDDFAADSDRLIADIHGISEKPPLGNAPSAVRNRAAPEARLSASAEVIVRLMMEQTEHGLAMEPQVSAEDLKKQTALPDDDLIDAVLELTSRGLIREHKALGMGPLGFIRIVPEASLFSSLDEHFTDWDTESDALRIAAYLLNSDSDGQNVAELADHFQWAPRRINPAIHYLIERRIVDSSKALGTHPWCTHWIRQMPETRRWVRGRSQ